MTLWWALLLACRPAVPPASPGSFELVRPDDASVRLEPVERPIETRGSWREDDVGAVIPPDWHAVRGPVGTPLILRATEPTTDSVVEVWVFQRTGRPAARPLAGCEPLLDDVGRYRAVPALPDSASHSCLLDDGTLVQGWYGVQGAREVHVEVRYPPGAGFAGRVAVEHFLRDITL